MLQIDVGDDASCKAAAKVLKSKGVKLYALVNNAGTMGQDNELMISTNYDGPKRVTDALVDLIESNGRIVNTR